MADERREKAPEQPAGRWVLSMELEIGDRFSDKTGEWEVIALPYTWNAGKTAHVHVRLVSPQVEGRLQPTVTALRVLGAHERINVKRATAEEGNRKGGVHG